MKPSLISYCSHLTTRERDVLNLLSYGYSFYELAKKLCISTRTIISYRKNIIEKLHARNTADLMRKGFELGILKIGKMREVA